MNLESQRLQRKPVVRLLIQLVLAFVSVAASVAAFRLGILWPLEHTLHPSAGLLSLLRRVGTIATALLGYWLFARFFEHRPVTEFAFKPVALSAGALSGVLLISFTILSLFALGNYRVSEYRGFDKTPFVLGTIFTAALLEEIVFRGVLFRILEQYGGTVTALIVQSCVFGVSHLFNTGTSPMTLISVTLIGAFWALLFVCTRNLWVTTVNHAAWNSAIFMSGVPLSGETEWRSSAPLASSYQGPHWLTGGGFGPEDSVINVVLMSAIVAGLAHWAWRRGRFVTRRAQLRRQGRPPLDILPVDRRH